MIKYPTTFVMGQGTGMNGPAAILGASNISMGLMKSKAK